MTQHDTAASPTTAVNVRVRLRQGCAIVEQPPQSAPAIRLAFLRKLPSPDHFQR